MKVKCISNKPILDFQSIGLENLVEGRIYFVEKTFKSPKKGNTFYKLKDVDDAWGFWSAQRFIVL